MRIVVLDGYTLNPGDNPWDDVAALGELTVYERTPAEQIIERAKDAEIILTNKTPLSAQTLEQLPKLRFVSVLATGYNVVDVAAARTRNIPVSNVPVYGTNAVAQFVFALTLELCHHVAEHSAGVKAGEWSRSPDFCYWNTPLIELAGKRMGIVGFGRIGRRVGELAHAFGMEVLASDVQASNDPPYAPFSWCSIEDLFARADFVTLHCPQTADNARFVNAALLQRMQRHAFFINTARGGLVNEADLADALHRGLIAGAAIDVVSSEPIAADNPLLTAPHCLITPHIAWAALAARQRLMRTTAENIAAFLAGAPVNVVN
ncbi:MAG TPA: D-2-hydroxyacid dehydrogenase [Candidatus Hydrogenedentes bacterium]|jgi:glycerate dehydrogenase|nr:D-2-hydroxyacid dehydrogenase [Candidatus Hydrogenedentota bacterium]HPJ98504.1 D-2-hydroxyacid dehydrogenase [Candidatus Hydrogenedentota bacterium]